MTEPHPAFVTLYLEERLRGCIGCMETTSSLLDTVREMAIGAAFRDPRFFPITLSELQRCIISVSVLTRPTPLADPKTVVPGVDGVLIQRGGNRGVYLPKVAAEQGWDSLRLLEEACIKARLPRGAWKRPETVVSAFRSIDFAEDDPDLQTPAP